MQNKFLNKFSSSISHKQIVTNFTYIKLNISATNCKYSFKTEKYHAGNKCITHYYYFRSCWNLHFKIQLKYFIFMQLESIVSCSIQICKTQWIVMRQLSAILFCEIENMWVNHMCDNDNDKDYEVQCVISYFFLWTHSILLTILFLSIFMIFSMRNLPFWMIGGECTTQFIFYCLLLATEYHKIWW